MEYLTILFTDPEAYLALLKSFFCESPWYGIIIVVVAFVLFPALKWLFDLFHNRAIELDTMTIKTNQDTLKKLRDTNINTLRDKEERNITRINESVKKILKEEASKYKKKKNKEEGKLCH